MKNCDTCNGFIKINWNDGRKGSCEHLDCSLAYKKGKPCKHYLSKKYNRNDEKEKLRKISRLADE